MRLTRFNKLTNEYEYHLNNPNTSMIQDEIAGIQKLGQLEDIEQELGIDLVTLFKALKNGCYIKPWAEIKYSYEIRTGSDNINLFLLDENDNDYSLKDYGKTWALTKEELL